MFLPLDKVKESNLFSGCEKFGIYLSKASYFVDPVGQVWVQIPLHIFLDKRCSFSSFQLSQKTSGVKSGTRIYRRVTCPLDKWISFHFLFLDCFGFLKLYSISFFVGKLLSCISVIRSVEDSLELKVIVVVSLACIAVQGEGEGREEKRALFPLPLPPPPLCRYAGYGFMAQLLHCTVIFFFLLCRPAALWGQSMFL